MPRQVQQLRPPVGPILPVVVHEAARPGPTTVITANVHGDEATGIAAVHALDARLHTELVAGRVVLLPTLNPGGLKAGTREVPPDGVDLNRLFPGAALGGGAERLARTIWDAVVSHGPDLVIDLHADSPSSIPYAIVDRVVSALARGDATLAPRLERLLEVAGLTALREYPSEQYVRYGLDRSLAGAVVNHAGVPAVTIEAGSRRAIQAGGVEASVGAVCNLLAEGGQIEAGPGPHPGRLEGGPWRRGPAPRARHAGVFVPERGPGAGFVAGDLLATVRSPGGRIQDEVRADSSGIVVSWLDGAWIDARQVTGTLGVPEGTR